LIEGFINPTKAKEGGKLIHLNREPFSSKSEMHDLSSTIHIESGIKLSHYFLIPFTREIHDVNETHLSASIINCIHYFLAR
jgi:hypothetical protein